MTAQEHPLIGFPPPFLGERPVRLRVLRNDPERGLIVVEKPAGVLPLPDNWYRRNPVLAYAINHQIEGGKPELERLGWEQPLVAVHTYEPEIAGAVVFSPSEEGAERLRNELAGLRWEFVFRLVALGGGQAQELQCSLPLARHEREPLMLVSHQTGKKAATVFRAVRNLGRFREWEARIAYPRYHQVFLHAFESGLRVLGDTRYARLPVPGLADFKRDYRPSRRFEEDPPLFDSPFVRLASLRLTDGHGGEDLITVPPPRKWDRALRLLEEFSGRSR